MKREATIGILGYLLARALCCSTILLYPQYDRLQHHLPLKFAVTHFILIFQTSQKSNQDGAAEHECFGIEGLGSHTLSTSLRKHHSFP